MKFNVTIDRDEDGVWIIECPSIPGCVSQGKTKEEALENIKDAIAACLQVRAERGLPLTVETQQVVDQTEQKFLRQQEIQAGYTITCVAYPLSDCTLETHQEQVLYKSSLYFNSEVET